MDPLAPLTRLSEGTKSTARLSLYALRATPPDPHAPKVLLLGGSNFDLRLKRGFLDTALAAACDIATYEPRGIGRSERPVGDWTMADYARDALAFLDALGWDRACVLGESFGGMTALHLALLAPDRIDRMVVASATAGGPVHASVDIARFLPLSREAAAREALCLQDTRNRVLEDADPAAFAARLADRIAFETAFADPSHISGGYARLLNARRGHDCTGLLDRIAVPTTIVAGRFDEQAPLASQRALADGLANATFHAFDGGHGLIFGLPAATQTALTVLTQPVLTQPCPDPARKEPQP